MRLNGEKRYTDEREQKIKRKVMSQYKSTKLEEMCYKYG